MSVERYSESKKKEAMIWVDSFDPEKQIPILEDFGKVVQSVKEEKKYHVIISNENFKKITNYDWIENIEYVMKARKLN